MNAVSALMMINLIGAEQRVINSPDDGRYAIRRIEVFTTFPSSLERFLEILALIRASKLRYKGG